MGATFAEHTSEMIFGSIFKHTTLHQDIVSLRFLSADVAVVEVLTAVTGVTNARPGMTFDRGGRLGRACYRSSPGRMARGKSWPITMWT